MWSAVLRPEGHRLDKAVRLSLGRREGGRLRASVRVSTKSASVSTIGDLSRSEARNHPKPGGPLLPSPLGGGKKGVPRLRDRAPALIDECEGHIEASAAYTPEQLEDPPEIRGWVWSD